MEAGYVKVFRKILESRIWSADDAIFKTFMAVLLNANWKQGFIGDHVIEPGQLAFSWRTLPERLFGDTKPPAINTVRNRIKKLERLDLIVVHPVGHQYSVITVKNWVQYQGSDPPDGTPASTQVDTPTDTNRRREKKGKKGKKELAPALIQLVDGWNSVADTCGLPKCKMPPTESLVAKWDRAQKDPEKRAALADVSRLLDAIREATFAHGKGWFTLQGLFSNNKAGESKLIQTLNGAYRGDQTKSVSGIRRSAGAKHTGDQPVDRRW